MNVIRLSKNDNKGKFGYDRITLCNNNNNKNSVDEVPFFLSSENSSATSLNRFQLTISNNTNITRQYDNAAKMKLTPTPPVPVTNRTSPYPKIIDQYGNKWHSNKSLLKISNLQRDRMPYLPTLNPDGSYVPWNAYLGVGQSMLRRRAGKGQAPHFEEDDERWYFHFKRLARFKQNFGHLNVPTSFDDSIPITAKKSPNEETSITLTKNNNNNEEEGEPQQQTVIPIGYVKLSTWCNRQRYQYSIYKSNGYSVFDPTTGLKTAFISPWRIHRLKEGLKFDFSFRKQNWNFRYKQLQNFHRIYGHANVQKCLLNEQINITRAVNILDEDENEEEGDLNNFDEGFYYWVKLQRLERKKFLSEASSSSSLKKSETTTAQTSASTSMTRERMDLLDNLNFVWDPRDALWNQRFDELTRFKEKFGHCRVSPNFSTSSNNDVSETTSDTIEEYEEGDNDDDDDDDDGDIHYYKLTKWVKLQRESFRKSEMSEERISKLNSLDFQWYPQGDSSWDAKYEQLVKYKKKTKNNLDDTILPPHLTNWINLQRKLYRNSELTNPTHIQKLKDIGFRFNTIPEEEWNTKYQLLKEFKDEFGHTNVGRTKHPQLGNWVHWQRQLYRRNYSLGESTSLTEERVQLLNELGFEWTRTRSSKSSEQQTLSGRESSINNNNMKMSRSELWNLRYNELLLYKEEHGNCRVPISYPKLGSWVSVQRVQYKKGKLSEERTEKLNEIGFEWSVLKKKDELLNNL